MGPSNHISFRRVGAGRKRVLKSLVNIGGALVLLVVIGLDQSHLWPIMEFGKNVSLEIFPINFWCMFNCIASIFPDAAFFTFLQSYCSTNFFKSWTCKKFVKGPVPSTWKIGNFKLSRPQLNHNSIQLPNPKTKT